MGRKKVVISGAASGIGAAVAQRFAREAWDVCMTDIQTEGLKSVALSLCAGNHLSCPADYGDIHAVDQLAEQIESSWGTVDALINCAGVFKVAHTIDSPLLVWQQSFSLMINGAVNLTRMCVPFMQNGGRIIHITSIHGERAEYGSSGYAMAKAALNQYCRALAVELAAKNILVNAIAPGFVDTPMNLVDGVNVVEGEWFKKNYIEEHHLPLKRLASPDEIAGVAFFLSGPDASYLTGQVITVDGGLSITF